MAQQFINTGSAVNTQTSDTLRDAMVKTEENFNELYDLFPTGLFPATASAVGPLQIVGDGSGGDGILGVTGSIEATEQISSPLFNFDEWDGSTSTFIPVISKRFHNKKSFIVYQKTSVVHDKFVLVAQSSDFPSYDRRISIGVDLFLGGKGVTFNQFTGNRYFIMYGTQGPIFFGGYDNIGTGNGYRVTVKIDPFVATKDFEVNGEIKANEYFTDSLPTSDPEVAGQWFTTSSKAAGLQDDSIKIICISQG